MLFWLSFSGHFATNEKLSQLIFERNLSDIAWALLDEILIIDEKENIVSIMDKHEKTSKKILFLFPSEDVLILCEHNLVVYWGQNVLKIWIYLCPSRIQVQMYYL